MELFCNALYIAAEEVQVVTEQEKSGQVKMTLDVTQYQQAKHISR